MNKSLAQSFILYDENIDKIVRDLVPGGYKTDRCMNLSVGESACDECILQGARNMKEMEWQKQSYQTYRLRIERKCVNTSIIERPPSKFD